MPNKRRSTNLACIKLQTPPPSLLRLFFRLPARQLGHGRFARRKHVFPSGRHRTRHQRRRRLRSFARASTLHPSSEGRRLACFGGPLERSLELHGEDVQQHLFEVEVGSKPRAGESKRSEYLKAETYSTVASIRVERLRFKSGKKFFFKRDDALKLPPSSHLRVAAGVHVAMALQEGGPQGRGVGEGAVVGDGQTVRVVGVQGLRFRAQRLGARRGVPVSESGV